MTRFLRQLEIHGLRGFTTSQGITFSLPDSYKPGSGLTIITGPNNSGKSTIVEALRARSGPQPPSFHLGMRNVKRDRVKLTYKFGPETEIIQSVKQGGAECTSNCSSDPSIFVLPSRRTFNPFFSKRLSGRTDYIQQQGQLPAQRSQQLRHFESRLFKILEDPDDFNDILRELLLFDPAWTIDQNEQGQHFLKFTTQGGYHSSDGLGEGVVSLFCIVDAFYDSEVGEIIVIDEPELSLHPAVQKRLSRLIERYSKDRQIIIATQSPYFASIESIVNGGTLVRTWNRKDGIEVSQIGSGSRDAMKRLASKNLHNPHVFGLDAREIFFLDDGIILVEGQEDVVCYPFVQEQLGITLKGEFFGWGAGGAGNMQHVCAVFKDLGFQKVCCILDGDQTTIASGLRKEFSDYHFVNIPADDVRDKEERPQKAAVQGLLNAKNKIHEQHVNKTKKLFSDINEYLSK